MVDSVNRNVAVDVLMVVVAVTVLSVVMIVVVEVTESVTVEVLIEGNTEVVTVWVGVVTIQEHPSDISEVGTRLKSFIRKHLIDILTGGNRRVGSFCEFGILKISALLIWCVRHCVCRSKISSYRPKVY
jgi:hypothetical protein